MRIVVTHHSPDLDAITSIWLIKKFLAGWEEAKVKFVPAGERLEVSRQRRASPEAGSQKSEVIERIGDDEVIHVIRGWGRSIIIKSSLIWLARPA